MVVLTVDESLSVTVTAGTSKPCAYVVAHEDEEIARYETSADPRTLGGRVGLRNIICRRLPNYEKTTVDETLSTRIAEHTTALTEELGPR